MHSCTLTGSIKSNGTGETIFINSGASVESSADITGGDPCIAMSGSSSLKIIGGTVQSSGDAIANGSNGNILITGGTVAGARYAIVNVSGTVEITGGTVSTRNDHSAISGSYTVNGGTVSILNNGSTLSFPDSDAYDFPAGEAGTSYTGTTALSATSNKGSITYSFEPAHSWLSIDANNKITGTRPSSATGATKAFIRATDASGSYAGIEINIGAVTLTRYGDINDDGVVSLLDVANLNLYLKGELALTGDAFTAADVYTNGTVNYIDLIMLKNYLYHDNIVLGNAFTMTPGITVKNQNMGTFLSGQDMTPYTLQTVRDGDVGAVRYALAQNSTFPAGLELSTDGVISGRPTTAGTYTFDVNAIYGTDPERIMPGTVTCTITNTSSNVTYVITKSGSTYVVNGGTLMTDSLYDDIDLAINGENGIKNDHPTGCTSKTIQFGSGGNNVLDIGSETANIDFNCKLTGSITGNATGIDNCVVKITGGASVVSQAKITNTYTNGLNSTICFDSVGTLTISGELSSLSGYAIYNTLDGTVNVSGGEVSSQSDRAIYNSSIGEINVSGGTVSSPSSRAIYNSSAGKVNVSGGTVSSPSGTAIYNYSTGEVNVSGGTVSSLSGKAIYNISTGTVNVSGGTVSSEVDIAISNFGTVNMSGGTVSTLSGTAFQCADTGTINVSGGTVSAAKDITLSEPIFGRAIVSAGTVNISGTANITSEQDADNVGTVDLYLEGSLSMTGGTVQCTGTSRAVYKNNAGSTATVTAPAGKRIMAGAGAASKNQVASPYTIPVASSDTDKYKYISIEAIPAPPPVVAAPTINTTTLVNGMVGTAYSQALSVTGTAPITWEVESGTLPAGLTLNTSTGLISGTPTTACTSSFTVKATNAGGSATKLLTITIYPVPTPTPTPPSGGGSSTPSIPSVPVTNNSKGWSGVENEIKKAPEGGTIKIQMNGTTTVPATILSAIKGKNVTLVLDMGSNISISINGKDVQNARTLDFGVKKNGGKIPATVINKLTGQKMTIELDFVYDGELGLTLVLNTYFGTQYNGLYANLLLYNEDTQKLEVKDSQKIVNGGAGFKFNHFSEWVIVIDKKAYINDLTVGEGTSGVTEELS